MRGRAFPPSARPSDHPGLDADLSEKRAMDGATIGDLKQAAPPLLGHPTFHFDGPLEEIDPAGTGLAFGTVLRVDPPMADGDMDPSDLPALAPRVHAKGHGGTACERRREKLVGVGTGVVATRLPGLVRREDMGSREDVERKRSPAVLAGDHRAVGRMKSYRPIGTHRASRIRSADETSI